jgi:hypothetical protein
MPTTSPLALAKWPDPASHFTVHQPADKTDGDQHSLEKSGHNNVDMRNHTKALFVA